MAFTQQTASGFFWHHSHIEIAETQLRLFKQLKSGRIITIINMTDGNKFGVLHKVFNHL